MSFKLNLDKQRQTYLTFKLDIQTVFTIVSIV